MIVTESQVSSALQHHGRLHNVEKGAADGIALPAECSKIADLLGHMWFTHEQEAQLPNGSRLAALVVAAFGIDEEVVKQVQDVRVRIEAAEGGAYKLVTPGAGPEAAGELVHGRPPQPSPQAGGAEAEPAAAAPTDDFDAMQLRACPLRNNGDEVCEACQ